MGYRGEVGQQVAASAQMPTPKTEPPATPVPGWPGVKAAAEQAARAVTAKMHAEGLLPAGYHLVYEIGGQVVDEQPAGLLAAGDPVEPGDPPGAAPPVVRGKQGQYRLGQLAAAIEERNQLREEVGALKDACDRAMRSAEDWEEWGRGWKARAEEARNELAKTWGKLDAALDMLRGAGVTRELIEAAMDEAVRKMEGSDGAAT